MGWGPGDVMEMEDGGVGLGAGANGREIWANKFFACGVEALESVFAFAD